MLADQDGAMSNEGISRALDPSTKVHAYVRFGRDVSLWTERDIGEHFNGSPVPEGREIMSLSELLDGLDSILWSDK